MNLIININLDNAAFVDYIGFERELERIIEQIHRRLDGALPQIKFNVHDTNGTTVGTVEVTE